MADSGEHPRQPDAPELLLARYAAGDDDAFRRLVERYEDRLFAFIARMTGDDHLAQDVFQQAFLNVARHARDFDGRASFSTWLYRIARNATLDALRRRARRPDDAATADDALDSLPAPRQESPLDRLAREEAGERIRAALAQLPEAQREAFLLKEEGNLDFAGIGAVLGCGRETAKSRFRLAVEKLRSLLAQRDANG